MSSNQTVLVADFLSGVADAAKLTITNAGRRVYSLACVIGDKDTAYINWNDNGTSIDATVYFPSSLDILGYMPRALADQWAAYWLHEIFHALFTDKAAWQVAVREGISDMVNALEDVRIERKAITQGIARNTKSLLENLTYEKLQEGVNKSSFDPNKSIAGVLAYAGREKLNGYNLKGFLAKVLTQLTPANKSLVLDTWDKLSKCDTTYDVNALAREVLKALQPSPSKPNEPSPPKPTSNETGKGEPSKPTEGQDDGEASSSPSEPTDGEGDTGEDEPCENGGSDLSPSNDDSEPSEDESEEGNNTKPGGNGASDKPSQENTLNTNLQPENPTTVKKTLAEKRKQEITNMIGSHIINSANSVTFKDRSCEQGNHSMNSTNGLPHSHKLDREIASLLRSPEKRGRIHNQTTGKLSRRALPRAVNGKLDVFSRKWTIAGNDTIVGVLVDMSGSMSGRIYETEKAVRMIARAIERSGTKSIIAGFRVGFDSTILEVIKPLAKKTVACHNASAILRVDGGTPMSPSIVAMARVLKDTPATRRIILCLTDGVCNSGEAGTQFASSYASKLGVEVLALGIGCNPSGGFPLGCAAMVLDARSLGVEGLGLLGKRLKEASPV